MGKEFPLGRPLRLAEDKKRGLLTQWAVLLSARPAPMDLLKRTVFVIAAHVSINLSVELLPLCQSRELAKLVDTHRSRLDLV